MANALVDGKVLINDKPVPVIPNSVSRMKGRGETKVNTQSLGGGNVDTVHSTDLETAKSKFKLSVRATEEMVSDVDAWKKNLGLNTIQYIAGNNVYEVYEEMSIIGDPEIPDSNDGKIDLEFEGKPLPA
jgi:hypothetical protein